MHSELLGTPLPDTPIYWLALLISITGGLVTMLHAVDEFLKVLKVIVLLGTLVITAVATTLYRRCQA